MRGAGNEGLSVVIVGGKMTEHKKFSLLMFSRDLRHCTVHGTSLPAEVGKVTFKINGDEALSDESV